ncbi:hypothetical protein Abin_012_016 [Acetobacter indonesiensis]|uniref:Uncharacterized protein n=1 Tax=Acetobacter indonesiensis TaxID=104101 RepID=A0ABQ0K5A3_9PROT|nr:hypothetical protein Abin_012_016 [Acetobacter indonesiensis]
MDAKSFKDDLKQVANAIFGISSDDCPEIEVFENPFDEIGSSSRQVSLNQQPPSSMISSPILHGSV